MCKSILNKAQSFRRRNILEIILCVPFLVTAEYLIKFPLGRFGETDFGKSLRHMQSCSVSRSLIILII